MTQANRPFFIYYFVHSMTRRSKKKCKWSCILTHHKDLLSIPLYRKKAIKNEQWRAHLERNFQFKSLVGLFPYIPKSLAPINKIHLWMIRCKFVGLFHMFSVDVKWTVYFVLVTSLFNVSHLCKASKRSKLSVIAYSISIDFHVKQ